MAETPTAEPTKAKTVSFTVAECSEFHNMGEFHENIATVKEAMEIFEKIPPERMSAIPAVWIRVADKENPEQVTEMDVIWMRVRKRCWSLCRCLRIRRLRRWHWSR